MNVGNMCMYMKLIDKEVIIIIMKIIIIKYDNNYIYALLNNIGDQSEGDNNNKQRLLYCAHYLIYIHNNVSSSCRSNSHFNKNITYSPITQFVGEPRVGQLESNILVLVDSLLEPEGPASIVLVVVLVVEDILRDKTTIYKSKRYHYKSKTDHRLPVEEHSHSLAEVEEVDLNNGGESK